MTPARAVSIVLLITTLFTTLLAGLLAPTSARAHEVLPAIADLETAGDRLTLRVEAAVEGWLAGIDLSEVADTNEAAEADTYDSLRALGPADLRDRFESFWPELAAMMRLAADGAPLDLALDAVEVPDTDSVETARITTFTASAALPADAEAVTFGWDRELGALVIRQQGVPEPFDGYLEPGDTTPDIALAGGSQAGPWQTFLNYIPVGVDHIVPLGLDHILFVLGLFFLSTQLGPLLWQISAFTLAHTITLALAALGYVSVPASIVEPIIAASIVYVAVENIFFPRLTPWRPAVVFGFGLLHGLGFASVLAEFGLPQGAFIPALIGFNIGVELGQLIVVAVAFLLVREAIRIDRGHDEVRLAKDLYILLPGLLIGAAFFCMGTYGPLEVSPMVFAVPAAALSLLCFLSVKLRDRLDAYRTFVAVPASAAIALVGAWWVIERTLL